MTDDSQNLNAGTELSSLVATIRDGDPAGADWDHLNRTLRDNPDAQRRYVKELLLLAALRRHHGNAKPLTQSMDAPGDLPAEISAPLPIYLPGCEPKPSRFRPHHYAIAIAAALLVAGISIAIVSVVAEQNRQREIEQQKAELAERIAKRPVATLIESTGNLNTPHGYPAEGSDYGRGEYTLDSGTAEFMLTNAINVKLRGETRMVMRNDMSVSLEQGSADFVVPNNATGFTVHLPDKSRIVDLGTAFSVRTNAHGHSHARVRTGKIEVIDAAGNKFVFNAGQSLHIVQGRVMRTWVREVFQPAESDGAFAVIAESYPYSNGVRSRRSGDTGFLWSGYSIKSDATRHAFFALLAAESGTRPGVEIDNNMLDMRSPTPSGVGSYLYTVFESAADDSTANVRAENPKRVDLDWHATTAASGAMRILIRDAQGRWFLSDDSVAIATGGGIRSLDLDTTRWSVIEASLEPMSEAVLGPLAITSPGTAQPDLRAITGAGLYWADAPDPQPKLVRLNSLEIVGQPTLHADSPDHITEPSDSDGGDQKSAAHNSKHVESASADRNRFAKILNPTHSPIPYERENHS